MALRALIFDVDGTLSETEEVHRRAFNEAFAAAGLDWHWDAALYGRLLKVTGGKERIAAFVRDHLGQAPDPERIAVLHAAKTARYGALVAQGGLTLRPGIAALIADARAAGLRLAVATTTSGPNVESLCRSCFGAPMAEVFDAIAAGDEVAAKKPAPDVYRLALDRLGLAAQDCVALEDSRNGLLSARAAGLRCLVSPSRYTAGEDFAEADARVDCFSAVAGIEALQARLGG
ncbi:HAD-IA family hydrolase [Polymorphum gilvum]|uniref:Putative haloacid dehalogenase-like hydrolase cbbY-like protein n=1 Tax=Polymorphum gilvum (strain LMG 25793 / CGMCC 1.9160 / SL003B-26A1) TaxID=991905 RepID=F2IXT1_POLGS|nr:HAD-IA family hydrolase [Polymorphum gilvum]ADZ69412.1 Putative haloacid dehalogenase-like hydrolase cbbY-like protein [Polymorphum gilvum SL003B-26A1]